jgi:hypothetical protein
MLPRPLALLLVSLLAWLLAGAQNRVLLREEAAWSARVAAADGPARIVDHQTRLRTMPVRLGERHSAPDASAAAHHETWLFGGAPRVIGRVGDRAALDSNARDLAFTYDATAPPTRDALRVARDALTALAGRRS